MNAASIVVVLAAVGVNFGWQPAEDEPGGYEYVVQIEPELLDVLKRGEKVPIESNVPPEVAPIRKVSIVVGRGDLPRESLGGVNRTAYFAGQPAWTPDRYNADGIVPAAAAASDDRYGSPPAFSNRSAVSPPPSILDRAETAFAETGSTLRDGVEAGIQAANEQLSRSGDQVHDSAVNAGQQFGQRLQEFASGPQRQLEATGNKMQNAAQQTLGTVGNQLQQVTNPFATAGTQPPPAANRAQGKTAPPPWPIAGSTTAPRWSDESETTGQTGSSQTSPSQTPPPTTYTPARTPNGWTSINPNVAGPPTVVPQLATAPRTSSTATAHNTATERGPAFPNSPEITRQPIHSVLADPSAPGAAQTPSDDWAAGWDNTVGAAQATIGRAANTDSNTRESTTRGSELVAVQPRETPQPQFPTQPQSQQASNNWSDSWADGDLWSQPPQSSPADTMAQSPPPLPATTVSQQATTTAQGSSASPGASANNVVNPAGPAASASDQPPWLPLLVVSLSLMGSLGANLFLGWSYMDARQKYRTLVQKTANAFRRTKQAAA
jgi:hypothetical protein